MFFRCQNLKRNSFWIEVFFFYLFFSLASYPTPLYAQEDFSLKISESKQESSLTAKIVSAGEYTLENHKDRTIPPKFKLKKALRDSGPISVKPGTILGITYVLSAALDSPDSSKTDKNKKIPAIPVEVRIYSPTPPDWRDKKLASNPEIIPDLIVPGKTCYALREFVFAWEILPGEWKIEVHSGKQILLSKVFAVALDAQAKPEQRESNLGSKSAIEKAEKESAKEPASSPKNKEKQVKDPPKTQAKQDLSKEKQPSSKNEKPLKESAALNPPKIKTRGKENGPEKESVPKEKNIKEYYMLRAGLFAEFKNAEKLIQNLKKEGHKTVCLGKTKADGKGQFLHPVYFGRYISKDEALKAQKKYPQPSILTSIPQSEIIRCH